MRHAGFGFVLHRQCATITTHDMFLSDIKTVFMRLCKSLCYTGTRGVSRAALAIAKVHVTGGVWQINLLQFLKQQVFHVLIVCKAGDSVDILGAEFRLQAGSVPFLQ